MGIGASRTLSTPLLKPQTASSRAAAHITPPMEFIPANWDAVYPLTRTANCKFAGSSAHITPHNRYIRFFCCAGRG